MWVSPVVFQYLSVDVSIMKIDQTAKANSIRKLAGLLSSSLLAFCMCSFTVPLALAGQTTAVNEGDKAKFTLTPQGMPSHVEYTISFRTADDTAVKLRDYKQVSGDLKFGNGVTSHDIEVETKKDCTAENTETFDVELYNLVITNPPTPNQNSGAATVSAAFYTFTGYIVDRTTSAEVAQGLAGSCPYS